MKNKEIVIFTVVFFLLINTSYYWEGRLGFFAIPVFLIFVAAYFALVIALFRQIYFLIKENFKTKNRLSLIGLLAIVLLLTYFKPTGIIDFDKLEGNDLLIAESEGAANCRTTIKLKENYTFKERVGCFGSFETKGKFRIVNDTIYFENVQLARQEKDYFQFAVVKRTKFENSKILEDLVLYKNSADTMPHELWITKNKLHKLHKLNK